MFLLFYHSRLFILLIKFYLCINFKKINLFPFFFIFYFFFHLDTVLLLYKIIYKWSNLINETEIKINTSKIIYLIIMIYYEAD